MTIVIHVVGVSNSGKTASIREFLRTQGIVFPDRPRDVLLVAPVLKNSNSWTTGIASGGDTLQIVNNNFHFFQRNNCQIIICPSKSTGMSYQAVVSNVRSLGAQHFLVHTRRESATQQQRNDNTRVAGEIWRHIP